MKKQQLHIGCSAFNNSYWKDIFYPEDLPRTKWFEYYCTYFNTYELNGTFYRFPTLKSLESWYDRAPEGFRYSIKMHKSVTHSKRFIDCQPEIDEFYAMAKEGLRNKLGCVLFQLPPGFKYTPERLELLIRSVNPDFKNVVEFRHESWWRSDVYETLMQNNITLCSVSYPKLSEAVLKTTPTGYARLHGAPKLFYSEYAIKELLQWYNNLFEKDFDEAFLYFNNTASAAGILNALQFKAIVQSP